MTKIDKLQHFLARYQDVPFQTGTNDCALFVADWINELTGTDFAVPFKGRYCSDFGSARLIRKHGFSDLEGFVTHCFNQVAKELENPMLAQRGDIVLVSYNKRNLCAIVAGTGVAAVSAEGLVLLPVSCIQKAWCITEVKA